MPVFIADAVGMAVQDGLAIYGLDRIHPGDVIVCNHAGVQGQHLNNTVMYTPIFAGADGKTLIGFFAINVHWIDIGGSAVGSITFKTTDIFMEGLQLRTVKLWSKGEPIEEVYRIIENNTRFPTELMGDIAAQLGGCLLGRELVAKLADKYGIDTFHRAIEIILDQSEAATRAKIAAMPDGVYTAEAFLDNDGVHDAHIPIRVKVIIKGDEMTVDYSEMADQVSSCINSGSFGGGRTTARVAFKYLIATGEPANDGTYRPLKLILPEGKLLSASPTAAMKLYPVPFPTVIDAIIKAMEPAIPQLVTGAHFGTYASFRLLGKRPNGTLFNCNDSGHGGWGACATHDGVGSIPHHGAWRHAHHPDRVAGVDLSVPDRGIQPARRLGRRRQIPRRHGFPQALSHSRALHAVGQLRSRRMSALGRLRRQERDAGPGDRAASGCRTGGVLESGRLRPACRRCRHRRNRRRRRLRRAAGAGKGIDRTRSAPRLHYAGGRIARLRYDGGGGTVDCTKRVTRPLQMTRSRGRRR